MVYTEYKYYLIISEKDKRIEKAPDARGAGEGLNGPSEAGGGDREVPIQDRGVVDQSIIKEPVGVFRGDHVWTLPEKTKKGVFRLGIGDILGTKQGAIERLRRSWVGGFTWDEREGESVCLMMMWGLVATGGVCFACVFRH